MREKKRFINYYPAKLNDFFWNNLHTVFTKHEYKCEQNQYNIRNSSKGDKREIRRVN